MFFVPAVCCGIAAALGLWRRCARPGFWRRILMTFCLQFLLLVCLYFLLRRFAAVELLTEASHRFLTGREVMSLLNMKPGPRVGELLDGLDMAVGTGKVNTLAKAEAWLRAQPVKQ